jgi:tetratricopeptide (TPR) repeat protein/predicted Ser/Thr protein kinase
MKCPKCHSDNPDTKQFCGDCGTQLIPAEKAHISFTKTLETPEYELTRGTILAGRYEIIEELGKGGMGNVYRVVDKKINEEVALKLIKPEIAGDKKTLERFGNELKLTRSIVHKHVGRMYHLGEDKGIHFITMEYVSGQDLKALIRQTGQLAVGTVIHIAKQICDGLSEAHKLGVVHRDLKPSNIMIDRDGDVRVMDFGIARSLYAKGITGAGAVIGTPEYMSPEQVEAKEVDQRSDIYSLGVILYEMVTGELPFEADSPFAVGIKHKSELPKDPKELNLHISDDLSRLILRCLEKEKGGRYQSAGELRSELERIERGLPTRDRAVKKKTSVTSKEITVSFNVRKVFIPVVLLIAVVLAGLLIWKPWSMKRPAPVITGKASLAVMYFKNNTGDKSLDHWRTALSDSIITDLSQSRYFDVLSSDRLFSILRKLDLLESTGYATEDLREIAAEGGVNFIVMGSLSRAGDTFRINYVIQEISSGKNRESSRVEGQGEASIFPMVDEITRQIKRDFDLSPEQIAGDIDREIGTITTRSAEAFKYYSEGRQAFSAGEYQRSVALMERAVEADPEFAMAYRSLAMAYNNNQLQAKSEKYMKKAYELSDRLPEREKYTIAADFFSRKQTSYDKAIENYKKLLELYPDDPIGNTNLAGIYGSLEQWDKAIEKYRTALQQKDAGIQTIKGLADMYLCKGQVDKARDALLDYVENHKDNDLLHRSLGFTYIIQRKFALALAEADKAFSLDPAIGINLFLRGNIFLFKGDFEAARLEYTRMEERVNPIAKVVGTLGFVLLDSLHGRFAEEIEQMKKGIAICQSFDQKGWEFNFHLKLGEVYLETGNMKEALSQLDQAWSIAQDRGDLEEQRLVLVDKGKYLLKTGSVPDALKTAEELKNLIEQGLNEKEMREYHYLMGLIECEKNDYRRAVDHLNQAKSLLPAENYPWDGQARFSFALGRALHQQGNLSEAQQACEEILQMTFGRLFYPKIYVLAFYELGRVFQDQGNAAQAIETYEKFLDLWKDADPGIGEVEDARERLDGLKGH